MTAYLPAYRAYYPPIYIFTSITTHTHARAHTFTYTHNRTHSFPNVTQWVTEYGYADQDLATTQAFFNQSAEYLDRLDSVSRYSYFGAFRSEASNVGPNVAMLSDDGQLTDVGSWYLGGSATGVDPQSAGMRRGIPVTGLVAVVAVLAGVVVLLW